MSEENTGGFLQSIQNREGTSLATTIEYNGYLILTGKEMAVFKVSEMFTQMGAKAHSSALLWVG